MNSGWHAYWLRRPSLSRAGSRGHELSPGSTFPSPSGTCRHGRVQRWFTHNNPGMQGRQVNAAPGGVPAVDTAVSQVESHVSPSSAPAMHMPCVGAGVPPGPAARARQLVAVAPRKVRIQTVLFTHEFERMLPLFVNVTVPRGSVGSHSWKSGEGICVGEPFAGSGGVHRAATFPGPATHANPAAQGMNPGLHSVAEPLDGVHG